MKRRLRLKRKKTVKPGEDHTSPPIHDSASHNAVLDMPLDSPLDDVQEPISAIQEDAAEGTAGAERKGLWSKKMIGKPVFLEDTGEKLGVVFDSVIDSDKHLLGYKVQDAKSDAILSFPLEQFEEDKNGLIFIPSWYSKGIKTVEKLEFKDRITPELMWLIDDKTLTTEEIYRIFSRFDDSLIHYVDEAVSLREQLLQRLTILEKERLGLKASLMDLTEKRLIKDIDRRQFSDIVMEHRRKVIVLDGNLKKCKDLLDRLQKTSFGALSTTIHQPTTSPGAPSSHPSRPMSDASDTTYQEKYYQLKQDHTKLQEGYEELRTAVDRLLSENEL